MSMCDYACRAFAVTISPTVAAATPTRLCKLYAPQVFPEACAAAMACLHGYGAHLREPESLRIESRSHMSQSPGSLT